MAEIADYLPGGKNDPNATPDGIDTEINDAANKQQARKRDPDNGQFVATPEETNWEDRYKELEKLNSRQAQDLGTYRKMVDDYISNPTSVTPVVEEKSQPITEDEFYDNPADAVDRAVDAHPAILEAKRLKEDMQKRQLEDDIKSFQDRHPDFNEISTDPKFRNWVEDDATRVDLYQRGNSYDLSAADALFSLYKAENNITQMTAAQEQQQQIDAASLEDSSNIMVQEAPKYSRSEYVDYFRRYKQGDLEAERWVQRNAAGYREALASGNVRD